MARTRGAHKDELAAADPTLPPSRIVPRPPDGERLPWDDLFEAGLPVEADIGFGMGRFLLARAAGHPDIRFLGLELEAARVLHVDVAARRAGLANLRLLQGDALQSLPLLPDAVLRAVTVYFPDPWPKRRHWKRRLVQAPFVDAVHRVLQPGGVLHLATDQATYLADMRRLLGADPRFRETTPLVREPHEWTDFERLFRSKGETVGEASYQKL